MARLLAVLLALAAVVGLGACGSDDAPGRAAYVDAVDAAQRAFAKRFDTVSITLPATSTPEQDAAALQRFRDACEQTARELKAIQPPAVVAEAHGRLVAAVTDYAAELGRLRAGLTGPQGAEAQASVRTALSSGGERLGKRFTDAVAEVNRELAG